MKKTYRKWLKRAAVLALAAALVLILLDLFLLPRIVRSKFAATLEALGLPPATFNVDHASLWGADLSQIHGEGLDVPRLSIRYRPLQVISGHLNSVELVGVELHLAFDHGRLKLAGPNTAPSQKPPAASKPASSGSLPFRHLDLISCVLLIDSQGTSVAIPFDGALSPAEADGSHLNCTAHLLNATLKVTGTLNAARRDADIIASADNLDIASLAAVLPVELPQSFHAGGRASFSANLTMRSGVPATVASLQIKDGWLAARANAHVLVTRGVALNLATTLDQNWRPAHLAASVTSPTLALDRSLGVTVQLAVQDAPDAKLNFNLALLNPQWGLQLGNGKITGLLRPADQIEISTHVLLKGQLPSAASDALLDAGVDTSRLGTANVDGDISAAFPFPSAPAQGWHGKLKARAALDRGDIWLPRAALSLVAFGASADLDATFDNTRLAAVLHQGATLFTRELHSLRIERGYLAADDPAADLIDFTLMGADATLLFPFTPNQKWTLDFPALRLRLAPTTSTISTANIRRAAAILQLDARLTSGACALAVDPASWIGEEGIQLPAGNNPITLGPFWATLKTADAATTKLAYAAGNLDAHLALAALPAKPLTISCAGNQATLQNLELSAACLKNNLAPPTLLANLAFSQSNLALTTAHVELSDLAANVPISFNAPTTTPTSAPTTAPTTFPTTVPTSAPTSAPTTLPTSAPTSREPSRELSTPTTTLTTTTTTAPTTAPTSKPLPGTFVAHSARVGPDTWPGLTGVARFTNGRFDLSSNWPILKAAALKLDASFDPTPADGPRADLHLWTPSFTLATGTEISSLISSAKGTSITGDFAADARITLERGRLTPKITLNAGHANIKSEQYDAAINDISTNLTFDSFTPFSTPGNQRLTIGAGSIGKLQVNGGQVAFRVESPRSILIEETDWAWAGGHLYSHAVRIDPKNPVFDFVAYGESLSMAQLLKLFAGQDATGDGTLYGRLPVHVAWPSIAFGTGYLYATPGNGALSLSGESAKKFGDLLSKDPRFASAGGSNFVRDRIVQSLKNFHYDMFKVDFNNSGDNLLAAVKLRGSGTIGKDTQELGLDINVNGFDQLLRNFLVIKSILGK